MYSSLKRDIPGQHDTHILHTEDTLDLLVPVYEHFRALEHWSCAHRFCNTSKTRYYLKKILQILTNKKSNTTVNDVTMPWYACILLYIRKV